MPDPQALREVVAGARSTPTHPRQTTPGRLRRAPAASPRIPDQARRPAPRSIRPAPRLARSRAPPHRAVGRRARPLGDGCADHVLPTSSTAGRARSARKPDSCTSIRPAGLDQPDDLVQLQQGVLLRTERIGLPEHLLVLAGVSEVRVKGVEAAGAGRSRNRVTGGVRSGEAPRLRPSPTRFPEDVPVGGAEPKIAVAGDSDAPGAQSQDAAGEERRFGHSEPPVEHLGDRVRLGVLRAQQLDLELEHRPDGISGSAGESAVTAVARLLEAPEAPQGLGQDQLVGGTRRFG